MIFVHATPVKPFQPIINIFFALARIKLITTLDLLIRTHCHAYRRKKNIITEELSRIMCVCVRATSWLRGRRERTCYYRVDCTRMYLALKLYGLVKQINMETCSTQLHTHNRTIERYPIQDIRYVIRYERLFYV